MSSHEERKFWVAELLQEKGDTLDVPRAIQHWAYFPTAEGRIAFIALLGVRFESIQCLDAAPSGDSFGVSFFHVGLPDGDSITLVTSMLDGYARDCGGEYDGWETQVLS